VSQLVTSHFNVNTAEWIGKADSIKPLNHYRKAFEKKKCISWVISDCWNMMAKSRDEVHSDLINRTECLEGNGKEMIINCRWFQCTYLPCIWLLLQLLRQLGCTSRWYAQVREGHSVSEKDDKNTLMLDGRHKTLTWVPLAYRCGAKPWRPHQTGEILLTIELSDVIQHPATIRYLISSKSLFGTSLVNCTHAFLVCWVANVSYNSNIWDDSTYANIAAARNFLWSLYDVSMWLLLFAGSS